MMEANDIVLGTETMTPVICVIEPGRHSILVNHVTVHTLESQPGDGPYDLGDRSMIALEAARATAEFIWSQTAQG